MGRYVALLRGINVGGKNIIKMADLRASFEAMGFDDVQTYIQSGNVVFSSSLRSAKQLVAPIAEMLSATFDYAGTFAVLSKTQVKNAVNDAPEGFGAEPRKLYYDVLFLLPPLTAQKALVDIPVREGVDTAYEGRGVVYFTRLVAQASKSRLSRITGLPIYQRMTVRNWNTTTQLLKMVRD